METTQENAAIPAATPEVTPNPLERTLDLVVSKAEIDSEVGQQLKRMARTAKVHGFRPGKVPMKMVEQMYGQQARGEAIGAAVEKAFGLAVRAQNLRVAGQPSIDLKAGGNGGEMEFTATFEVFPEFKIAEIGDKSIEKPALVVGDEEIDKTIEVLRKQRTRYEPAGRAAENGDRLVIDFTGRRNGEEFDGGKAVDYPVFVGGGMMLPDFEAALSGVVEGQEKTFDVKFPDDYHAQDLAGSLVQFSIVVKSVEAPKLPDLDGDFARSLGVADGDLVKMRAEVRANLEREVTKRLNARVKEQAMNALLEANPIDVPRVMVDAESHQMAENARQDLERRGAQLKNLPVEASWFTDQAVRRVRLGLIVAELVRERDLHVKPDQVRAIVDDFAATFEDPQDVVRWYYGQPERLAEAEALAMENNVVDWVLANAKVVEKSVSFDELMERPAS